MGEIGADLLASGRGLFTLWHRWHDGLLTCDPFEQFMGLLRQWVELILTEGAYCGHPAIEHTCQHPLELKEALWTFVDTPGVDPTNNAAERALWESVIRCKLSFETQSTHGNCALSNDCRRWRRLADNKAGRCSRTCARLSKPFCLVTVPDS